MVPVTLSPLPNEIYPAHLNAIWCSEHIINNGPPAIQIAIKELDLRGEIITTPYAI